MAAEETDMQRFQTTVLCRPAGSNQSFDSKPFTVVAGDDQDAALEALYAARRAGFEPLCLTTKATAEAQAA